MKLLPECTSSPMNPNETFTSVDLKNIAIHNAPVFEIRLVLLLYILLEYLEKLAHQPEGHLVPVFGTFPSSNNNKDKMLSLYFAFHTSLFQPDVFSVRYLSGAFGC